VFCHTTASQVNHYGHDDEQPPPQQQQQQQPRRRRQQSNGVANDAEIIINTAAGDNDTTNVSRGQCFCEAVNLVQREFAVVVGSCYRSMQTSREYLITLVHLRKR